MFTFLRKIRRSLISSGSTRKYLLYAFGEITLVVIGILIALQVNNWNIERIEKREEVHYLQRIIQDLNLDLIEIEQVVRSNHLRLLQIKNILDIMGDTEIGADELSIYHIALKSNIDTMNIKRRSFGNGLGAIRYYDSFNRSDLTFQELLANGKIDNIRNESVKIAILSHYSQIDDRLQLVSMTETMRNEYVRMLVDLGIGMYYDGSYKEFTNEVPEYKALIAQIHNIFYITNSSQRSLRYSDDSLEKSTTYLIYEIEEYLNE